MKVAIGQISGSDDKAANLAAIEQSAAKAARDGASLVVFPEMAMWFKHGLDFSFHGVAEPVPGKFTDAIDALARKYGIAIVAGMAQSTDAEPRVFNTAYVTSSKGEQVGIYHKVHLYDAFGIRESDVVAPSSNFDPVTFELDGLRFGLMTCYDLRFPESARVLIDAGCDVLVLPSLWTPGVRKEDHWETLVRARAIENTAYVIAANHAAPMSTGASMVVDPMGIVAAQLSEGPDTATVDISKERITAVRAKNPCVSNRRYRVERIAEASV